MTPIVFFMTHFYSRMRQSVLPRPYPRAPQERSTTMGAIDAQAQRANATADSGRGWYAVLARTGLVAKGVSYGLVGVLAIRLALGGGGKATSRQGALESLAQHSFGKVVLFLLALGFAAYALWRLVQAWAERTDGDTSTAEKWGKRAGYVGRGLIYVSLTWSTLHLLTGADEQSQNQQAHHNAARALGWPAGRWIVGAAGLVLAAYGLWNLYRGLARKFEKKWRVARLTPSVRRWGSRAGVAGHVARCVVFGLIGIFVVKAALDYDPRKAIGLDGALQKLAHASYGPFLLGLTAAGLLAYAVYCFVDARLRDVSANQ
jgi:formate hydrogenlyase subunit 3/multisubunit Na+/H+ antiporter MnhD subunit